MALETAETRTQANLIRFTLVRKWQKIGPEFWPTQLATIPMHLISMCQTLVSATTVIICNYVPCTPVDDQIVWACCIVVFEEYFDAVSAAREGWDMLWCFNIILQFLCFFLYIFVCSCVLFSCTSAFHANKYFRSVLWCCWLGDRKCIRPVKSTALTLFLAHLDSLVAACSLQVRNTVIVTGGMLSWSPRARQPTQPSVLPICLGSMGWLMVGWQEGHAMHKKSYSGPPGIPVRKP